MPELPEVQTFINQLKPLILNKKITFVKVLVNKILKNTNINHFQEILVNQEFSNLTRVGKYLVFHLTNDWVMLLHLRMEGKPFYYKQDEHSDFKHVLVQIQFNNNHEIRYHDTRRFGTIHLYPKNEYMKSKEISKLGLDPTDSNFSKDYLKKQLLKVQNQKIKTALLDQTKLAGIGNIYADEIVFDAKIHPNTLIKNLKDVDFQNLTNASVKIIAEAIKQKGTSIVSYKYKDGTMGNFQNQLKVHMRKNLLCYDCNNIIEKIKVNGRGTYFCNKCQVLLKK